jgi:uncharacterized 2Fe-2S/4Fe-4S cluster protein (DUF4445 family)
VGDALVVFSPSGKRGRFPLGTPVLTAARALGVDLDSVCGGRGICARCQVEPAPGAGADALSPWNAVEQRLREKRGLADGRRLGCQARVTGDVVVDVPPESRLHRPLVRKRAEARAVALDPATRLLLVEVEQPDMRAPTGDLERLTAALAAQWGVAEATAELHALRRLQPALRAGGWTVTVAVHAPRADGPATVLDVWPGFFDGPLLGAAVDLGSTTVACHLCDLRTGEVLASAGAMNPQIRFGEDLMSRVSHAMLDPGGTAAMAAAARGAIAELVAATAAEAGVAPGLVVEAVVVGNPVMHHLLLGLDPTELGGAPFALAAAGALTVRGDEIGLGGHPAARVYLPPCVAGHVGADAAAVALSESPHLSDDLTLIVDVGTNAEILLGDRGGVLACSSPTGPAFEGAQIACGQRAAPGAIERVRIDPATRLPRFRVVGCDLWSDEPGFAEAVAGVGVTGICGSGIVEAVAEMRMAGIVDADGAMGDAAATGCPAVVADGRTQALTLWEGGATGPRIVVTQGDVRAIQLAKAALHAGARLLMDERGVDRVDRIVLTGGFGAHVSPLHAMALGMIPDAPLDRVSAAGNAAGTGARIALLNRGARAEVEALARRIVKVETAVAPRFQERFVAAMALPHATEPFPNLRELAPMPTVSHRDGAASRRRRRPAA